MTTSLLNRQLAAHRRARRLLQVSDRVAEQGVRWSVRRATTHTTHFRRIEDFLDATDRYSRAAFRRFSLARRLRSQAFDLVAFGTDSGR